VNGAVLYLAAGVRGRRKAADDGHRRDRRLVAARSPRSPRVPTEATYVADAREPILLVSGSHLLFCSRADANLHIFDLVQPLAPKKVAELALPATPQEGFADDEGALITQLGRPEIKLGPTSTSLHLDASTGKLVATGDALSVWQLERPGSARKSPELLPTNVHH
jgi:hypothetical protein